MVTLYPWQNTMFIDRQITWNAFFILSLGIAVIANGPLLLTSKYLNKGDVAGAKTASRVNGGFSGLQLPTSHAGYLTVNKDLGKHMFFWFVPCENCQQDRLVIWLNGGPGTSSMLGAFWENGPVQCVTAGADDVKMRADRWSKFASILYIDNPVGVGFSYSESGAVTTETSEIMSEMFIFLKQFYTIWPEYKTRELYLGGQSYAGKYVPEFAAQLHGLRQENTGIARLTGIYLGGPLYDPATQILELAVNSSEKSIMIEFMQEHNSGGPGMGHGLTFNNLMMQILPYFVYKVQDNTAQDPVEYECVKKLMNKASVKRALHVDGSRSYSEYSGEAITNNFGKEFFLSTRTKLKELMNTYKVLIYSGDLDGVVKTSAVEAPLTKNDHNLWKQENVYRNKLRNAASQSSSYNYAIKAGNLCRVSIRGAGHQAPHDKPEVTSSMMSQFLSQGCVNEAN